LLLSRPAAAAAQPRAASAAPPGPAIVYERNAGGNLDIYMLPAGGGPERRLTDHPADDALPRFTPDGRSVIFSSKRSGHWQLLEVAVGGGPSRPLRSNQANEWQADPSPEGNRVAFLSDIEGPQCLFVLKRASRHARKLLCHGERSVLGNPHWHRDGRRILFSSNWQLPGHRVYVVDVATGRETRLSPLSSGACEPRFSPDGRKAAYVRRQHATRERSRIVEHDLETGAERMLVEWPALNYDPVYSPDGLEIAFASNVSGEYAIHRLRLADGQSWRVTTGAGPARHPDYAPAR
jgi:Tol biopolymer transport system component